MKQLLVSVVFLMFLVSCGGGTTPVQPQPQPQPTGSEVIAGTYNGNLQIVDDAGNKFLNGLTTFTVAKDGKVTGTITTNSSARPKNETGTLSGTIIYKSILETQFDLVAVYSTAGTYSGKGKGFFSSSTDALGGQLTGKTNAGVVVDSFILNSMREQ